MCVKEIKKAMVEKDLNITKLAKKLYYNRTHISRVIHGHHNSPRVRKAIADALEKKPEQLWSNG